MKKLLILFVAIILSGTIAGSAVPIGLTIMGGDGVSGGEGGGCTTANDEALYSELVSDSSWTGTVTGSAIAGSWDPGATVTITGYKWWVQDNEQVGGLISELQGDSGTYPNDVAVDGTSSTELGHASIDDASMVETWFELATPQQVSSASMWVVLRDSGSAGTWIISREDSNVHAGSYAYNNGSWGTSATRDVKVEIWGCP